MGTGQMPPDPQTPPGGAGPNATQAPPEEQPTARTIEQLMQSDDPAATNQLLGQLLKQQADQRAEIAALRDEARRVGMATAVPAGQVPVLSDEEKLRNRMEEIAQAEFYCPACGNLSGYHRQCSGKPGVPGHPVEEMVSTDELRSGDPARHTAAQAVAA